MSTFALLVWTQQESGSSVGGFVFLLIVVVVLVLIGWHFGTFSQFTFPQFGGSVTTADRSNLFLDQSPQEIIDIVTGYLAQEGFAVRYRSENTATFTRPKKADTGLGCFLLLLGLIPGLLYFGLFRGTHTTTVTALHRGNGTQIILSGDDTATQRKLIKWLGEHLGAHSQG